MQMLQELDSDIEIINEPMDDDTLSNQPLNDSDD